MPDAGQPGPPFGNNPADGATGEGLTRPLNFQCPARATSADVALGLVDPPPPLLTQVPPIGASSFLVRPPTALMTNATYFWRATCVYPTGSVPGPVWRFSTTACTGEVLRACTPATVLDADGTSYGTLDVCGRCWMASNLRVGVMRTLDPADAGSLLTDNGVNERLCPRNDPALCGANGGLYQWGEATNYGRTTHGACPVGWRLPTDGEWKQLEESMGMSSLELDLTGYRGVGTRVGAKLRTVNSTSNFDALFPGYATAVIGTIYDFANVGVSTKFWTSSAVGPNAWARELNAGAAATGIRRALESKRDAFSIRCVQE